MTPDEALNRWKDGCPYNHEHAPWCDDAEGFVAALRAKDEEIERLRGVLANEVKHHVAKIELLKAAEKALAVLQAEYADAEKDWRGRHDALTGERDGLRAERDEQKELAVHTLRVSMERERRAALLYNIVIRYSQERHQLRDFLLGELDAIKDRTLPVLQLAVKLSNVRYWESRRADAAESENKRLTARLGEAQEALIDKQDKRRDALAILQDENIKLLAKVVEKDAALAMAREALQQINEKAARQDEYNGHLNRVSITDDPKVLMAQAADFSTRLNACLTLSATALSQEPHAGPECKGCNAVRGSGAKFHEKDCIEYAHFIANIDNRHGLCAEENP